MRRDDAQRKILANQTAEKQRMEEQSRADRAKISENAGAGKAEIDGRISELEKRVRRMESSLDAILMNLDQMAKDKSR